jgi:hypothetical protein
MIIAPRPDELEAVDDDEDDNDGDVSWKGGQYDVTVLSWVKKLTPDWP